MKIIISILASYNENYDLFKQVWIKSIKKFKATKYKDLFDFYFL